MPKYVRLVYALVHIPIICIQVLHQSSHTQLWFTRVQRDGIGSTLTGAFVPMAQIASYHVRLLATERGLPVPEDIIAEIGQAFRETPPYDQVLEFVRTMHAHGVKICTLTNGARNTTLAFLRAAGLDDLIDEDLHLEVGTLFCCTSPFVTCSLSTSHSPHTCTHTKPLDEKKKVSGAASWKPKADPYRYAAATFERVKGIPQEQLLYITAQVWDAWGSAAAGLPTALLTKAGVGPPPYITQPTHTVGSLAELVAVIAPDAAASS